MQYQVTWTIDIEADSFEAAAIEARAIQQDKGSEAVVYDVVRMKDNKTISVDLLETNPTVD